MALPISYHWRNLFVRKTTTMLTVLVVAAVVGTFTWMLGFTLALTRTLSVAGDEGKLLVMRRGTTAESNSALPIEDFNKLSQLAEVATDPKTNRPLITPSMLVQVQLPRLNDRGESMANVAVRGVLENAFDVHRNVRIADGRNFASGAREIIVGKSAAQQFAGLKLGDTVQLGYGGDRDYVIVGHFDADGGPLESEIWGYLPSLMNAYNRELYSSANLRLVEGADARAVKEQIAGPAIQLLGQTESEYWRGQTKSIGTYLLVAYILAAVMCIAAVSSLAITMFSAVAGRTREIAMLRTIGFSPRQILIGFVLESVLLCLIGGAVGLVGCQAWLLLFGSTKDMYGAETFTTLAFEIRLNHWTVIGALVAVVVVGVIGSLPPAWRAARVQVISALRQA